MALDARGRLACGRRQAPACDSGNAQLASNRIAASVT